MSDNELLDRIWGVLRQLAVELELEQAELTQLRRAGAAEDALRARAARVARLTRAISAARVLYLTLL